MAVLAEEGQLLVCNRCHARPRATGKRMTWCRQCKSDWQRDYRQGVVRQKRIPDPVQVAGGCLIFQGRINKETGYGQVRHEGVDMGAHRAAWIKAKGPIPEGMTVDHLCEVKACVNVDHFELVTRGENTRRYYERRCM